MDCARRDFCQAAFGRGFDSRRLHQNEKSERVVMGNTFGFFYILHEIDTAFDRDRLYWPGPCHITRSQVAALAVQIH